MIVPTRSNSNHFSIPSSARFTTVGAAGCTRNTPRVSSALSSLSEVRRMSTMLVVLARAALQLWHSTPLESQD